MTSNKTYYLKNGTKVEVRKLRKNISILQIIISLYFSGQILIGIPRPKDWFSRVSSMDIFSLKSPEVTLPQNTEASGYFCSASRPRRCWRCWPRSWPRPTRRCWSQSGSCPVCPRACPTPPSTPSGPGGLHLSSRVGLLPSLSQVPSHARILFRYLLFPETSVCSFIILGILVSNYICSCLGMYMGTVIAMPLAGILAQYVSWEAIFYVFGEFVCNGKWKIELCKHLQDFWLWFGACCGGSVSRTLRIKTGRSRSRSWSISRTPSVWRTDKSRTLLLPGGPCWPASQSGPSSSRISPRTGASTPCWPVCQCSWEKCSTTASTRRASWPPSRTSWWRWWCRSADTWPTPSELMVNCPQHTSGNCSHAEHIWDR